jgi:hypothetical protein
LESVARGILKKYDPLLVTGEPRAIPIEEIVEQQYGLDVEYRCLRKNGIALGCTVFDGNLLPFYDMERRQYELLPVKSGTIVIDIRLLDSQKDGRLRFTFAHELAHWLIHQERFSGSGFAAASTAKTSLEVDPDTERQADILATALLMPAGQVKRAFYHYRNSSSVSLTLAELFNVSNQAMGIFLRDHHLV